MRGIDRRDFMKLMGLGGAVFASSLSKTVFGKDAPAAYSRERDFYFVQLSDTHWGFDGPAINPDPQGTLKKAIATINSLEVKPDFIVFTGDLTHITEDATKRRDRLAQFKDAVGGLEVNTLYFMPGEHDASLDRGDAYQKLFGKTHYSFDHKGIHFITLDNVSDPGAMVGQEQIEWLRSDLKRLRQDSPIVVFTHRPLFDLYPQWDWTTRDASDVINALMPYKNVTVFYGHIHQEHHFTTGHITHHAAKSLMFALPAPGSAPKRAPVAWDESSPYRGLGFREVETGAQRAGCEIREMPVINR